MTIASTGLIRHEHTPDGGILALYEATDMLHRAMCLVPYLPSGMVVAIAVESVTWYIIE